MGRRTVRRTLALAALSAAIVIALIPLVALVVLPWLGRRGDLNRIVEGIIASALSVPVRIGRVDTEPLSRFRITRLRSVAASAEERFRFRAPSVSVTYDPVELLAGRLRSLVLDRPEIFVDLDSGLGGVARPPRPPPEVAPAPGELSPITVERTIVEDGTVTARLEGRDLTLAGVRIEIREMGRVRGQEVVLSANALGGTIRFEGAVDAVIEPGRPYRWAVRGARIEARGLSLAGIAPFLPPALARAVTGASLDLEGTAEGTWPEAVDVGARVTARGLDGGTVDLRASIRGLSRDPAAGGWTAASFRLDMPEVPAPAIVGALRAAGVRLPIGLRLGGSILVAIEAERGPPLRGSAAIGWRGGSLDLDQPIAGARAVEAEATVRAAGTADADRLAIEIEGQAAAEEVLAGVFYAPLGRKPARLSARGSWTGRPGEPGSLVLDEVSIETPLTGPISAKASIVSRPGLDGPVLDISARAPRIPVAAAFGIFLRDPVPWMPGDASLGGEAALSVRIAGPVAAPRIAGLASLGGGILEAGGLRIEGLDVAVPFALGPRAPGPERDGRDGWDGWIAFDRLAAGPVEVEAVRIPFRLDDDGGHSLSAPARAKVLGGTVEIRAGNVSTGESGEPSVALSLRARDLDLARITRAAAGPVIAGSIDVDLSSLTLRGSRLEAPGGEIVARAFGGEAAFSDLVIDNLARPYADLRLGQGRIRGVRLEQVGKAFGFGVVSGVLDGTVRGLTVAGGEPISFDIDVRTVPTPGVPQHLDRRAIESIRRVLSGPLGAVEEVLFGRVAYDSFGFRARLEDEVLHFRGHEVAGGIEYIMRSRWYQFPRISIINRRPGKPYDWKSILANLRAVYRSGDERPEAADAERTR